MKKILLFIILIMGSLSADLATDGLKSYNDGNKQKAYKLWRKHDKK